MATNPVRVIIELDVADDCLTHYEGVRHLSPECKDEIVSRVSDYATMVYISEV